jgi:hypothetical protein
VLIRPVVKCVQLFRVGQHERWALVRDGRAVCASSDFPIGALVSLRFELEPWYGKKRGKQRGKRRTKRKTKREEEEKNEEGRRRYQRV